MKFNQFQVWVDTWVQQCFGSLKALTTRERSFRFIEEGVELVQATGLTKEEVIRVVEHVYAKPVGQVEQEAGGVLMSMTVLCNHLGINMANTAQGALHECIANGAKIRAKLEQKKLVGISEGDPTL